MRSADRPVRTHPAPSDAPQPDDEAARAFGAAVAGFQAGLERQGSLRAEFAFEDIPAPKKLAPYATATAATVRRDQADIAWGRLVLLFDPGEPEGWQGCYRLISYLRAEIDPEIAADPMVGQVGWSWLIEALDARTPGYAAPSGTVTRVTTEGFGGKEDEPPVHGYEQRASWSPAADDMPLDGPDIAAHVTAWCDSLAAAAGLPPLALGARPLPAPGRAGEQRQRRRQ
jgi:Protein of unknown function (DUF3000)